MPKLARLIAALLAFAGATSARGSDLLGPPADDGPVEVSIGFYLSDVSRIDEENETIEFEGILTLSWLDPRQAFDPEQTGYGEKLYQGSYQFSEVYNGWWPQVFLANESGKYDRQGILLRIAPDGRMTYVEEMDAIAEARMRLRRFPFDRQRLYAVFEVLGFDRDVVALRADPSTTGSWKDQHHFIRIPQWHEPTLTTSVREYDPIYAGKGRAPASLFMAEIGIERDPGYLIRLVIFPLTTLVALSWSVFWMSRSSLGDRMDISFIGILTIVAYQFTISGLLPRISYTTLLDAYLAISFLTMAASVIVNLVIGRIDDSGRHELGDRIDRVCRWAFPLAYSVLMAIVCGTIYALD